MSNRSILALTLLACLTGCEDEAEVTESRDAAADVALTVGEIKPDSGPAVAVIDASVGSTDTQAFGPDARLDEFSWRVDPMNVQLRRGTCRELLVTLNRRPDFNDAVILGVGEGPFRVGFASTNVEPGASVGTIILATPFNAPAVNDKAMILAASGKTTYLRVTLNVTVLETLSSADGGVVETAADAGIWDNDTCGLVLSGLSKIAL